MDEQKLLERITVNTNIFGGKPIIRGRRLAVEHVLGMLAVGDTPEILLQGYPWLEKEDIQACLLYARRLVGHERIEPLKIESAAAGYLRLGRSHCPPTPESFRSAPITELWRSEADECKALCHIAIA